METDYNCLWFFLLPRMNCSRSASSIARWWQRVCFHNAFCCTHPQACDLERLRFPRRRRDLGAYPDQRARTWVRNVDIDDDSRASIQEPHLSSRIAHLAYACHTGYAAIGQYRLYQQMGLVWKVHWEMMQRRNTYLIFRII